MTGALDNDVLFKAACYGILNELAAYVDPAPHNVGVLGVAPYVVRRLISRAPLRSDKARLLDALDRFLKSIGVLEPDENERQLAATVELAAQLQGLPLHVGESQLCAIAILRGLSRIVTGDKRAIMAIERLLDTEDQLHQLCGNVHCVEQAIMGVLESIGGPALRSRICAEPGVDTALSMCFNCYSTERPSDEYVAGLTSYISAVRTDARRVLAA